ncbi:MAG: helix-turn-helix domain-containing protein [Sulfuritalea sp.]|nr:helix-turn-helix domain-containing protein [Sulfuritalea sp.]
MSVQVIRFSARQIEALERDDYASLPGSTAVRGLVRNYAKFLKLDAAPLLAQLDPAVPVPEADVRPPANMGEAEELTMVERVTAQAGCKHGRGCYPRLVSLLVFTLPPDPTTTRQSRDAAVPPSVQVAAPAVRLWSNPNRQWWRRVSRPLPARLERASARWLESRIR